jgi:hypothetical protein
MKRSLPAIAASVACTLGLAEAARAYDSSAAGIVPDASTSSSCLANTVSPPELLLRQDFNDVNLFVCSTSHDVKDRDLLNAVGSRVSAIFDELAHTTSTSIDGLGVIAIHYTGYTPGLIGFVMGPYVQGTRCPGDC